VHPLSHAIIIVVVTFAALSAADARAATFVVNTTADTSDDGECTTTPGGCSLREALVASNASSARDTIAFDPAVFPLGDPGVISLTTPLPLAFDPAGANLDGAGAGVVVQAGAVGAGVDGLVFSSGGFPLGSVRVANVTVRDFQGTAVVICGGNFPACANDVAKPVVENVHVSDTANAGVAIRGRAIGKARLTNVVASSHGESGIALDASGALVATRIEGCAVRDAGTPQNGAAGIQLTSPVAITGTSIANSVGIGNGGPAILVRSEGTLSNTKLTKVVATGNDGSGLVIGGVVAAAGLALADVVAVENEIQGVALFGGAMTGVGVKGLVANRNGGAGLRIAPSATLVGAKIADVRAVGNAEEGIDFLAGDVRGVQITRTVVAKNVGVGVRVRGSSNVLKRVRADANGAGIHLDAPGGGNVIEQCHAHGNDGVVGGAGIRVAAGNTGNVIRKNAAQINDGPNLADGNPDCAGNTWTDNFAVTNAACLD